MKNISLVAFLLLNLTAAFASNEVTIYSVYDGKRLDAVFKPFTQKTGIKVNIIDGTSDELLRRLKEEGSSSIGDLHIDKDLVYNTQALEADLYRPFDSAILENNISPALVETNKKWLTFLYRARVIMYNKNKVNPNLLSDYADLADPKWKNKLCLRTSTNSYNEALGAFMVKHYGEKASLEIFKGWVNNFSVEPLKGDRDVINAVANGTCDVTIANTYYLAPMIQANPEFPVGVVFPNQKTSGTHINGVGIGILKYSKNVKAANMLVEYLSSIEVQTPLADAFAQYPANKNAVMSSTLRDFGAFNEDQSNVGEIGKFVNPARSIMKEAFYK